MATMAEPQQASFDSHRPNRRMAAEDERSAVEFFDGNETLTAPRDPPWASTFQARGAIGEADELQIRSLVLYPTNPREIVPFLRFSFDPFG